MFNKSIFNVKKILFIIFCFAFIFNSFETHAESLKYDSNNYNKDKGMFGRIFDRENTSYSSNYSNAMSQSSTPKQKSCHICIYTDINPKTGNPYKCDEAKCEKYEKIIKQMIDIVDCINGNLGNSNEYCNRLMINIENVHSCYNEFRNAIENYRNRNNGKSPESLDDISPLSANCRDDLKDFIEKFSNNHDLKDTYGETIVERCMHDKNDICVNEWKNNCSDSDEYDVSEEIPYSEVLKNQKIFKKYDELKIIDKNTLYKNFYYYCDQVKDLIFDQSQKKGVADICKTYQKLCDVKRDATGKEIYGKYGNIIYNDYAHRVDCVYQTYNLLLDELNDYNKKILGSNEWNNIDGMSEFINNWKKEHGCTSLNIETQDHSVPEYGVLLPQLALDCFDEKCRVGGICNSTCLTFQNIGDVVEDLNNNYCDKLKKLLGNDDDKVITLTGSTTPTAAFLGSDLVPSYTITVTKYGCTVNSISCEDWENKMCTCNPINPQVEFNPVQNLLDLTPYCQSEVVCFTNDHIKKILSCSNYSGINDTWILRDINPDEDIRKIDPELYLDPLDPNKGCTDSKGLYQVKGVLKKNSRGDFECVIDDNFDSSTSSVSQSSIRSVTSNTSSSSVSIARSVSNTSSLSATSQSSLKSVASKTSSSSVRSASRVSNISFH